MTTRTAPATRLELDYSLPWASELDALKHDGAQYIVTITDEPRKVRSIVAKVNGAQIAYEHGSPKYLAAYIVEACNAYPQLVTDRAALIAALRDLVCAANGSGWTQHATGRALLRSLGEE